MDISEVISSDLFSVPGPPTPFETVPYDLVKMYWMQRLVAYYTHDP